MSRSYQSKCGLHRACLIPRLSGESPGARLRIWVILKAIHVKVGWVTCETRFLVFYSSLSTRPRHVRVWFQDYTRPYAGSDSHWGWLITEVYNLWLGLPACETSLTFDSSISLFILPISSEK